MTNFSRGQKGKLADLGLTAPFNVVLDIDSAGMVVDISCFGLDSADKLADERYMVFYNQLASPANEISMTLGGRGASFVVNLDALPASVAKLVFVAAIDGGGTMRKVGPSSLKLGDSVQFPWSGADFQDEKAVIVGEIYRKDGIWRFGAVGQGFNGGLSALLKHFGGTEAAPAAAPTPPAPASVPVLPAQQQQQPVSLSKVTLDKRGDKVSLDKRGGSKGFGRIHVNLNWNRGASGGAGKGIDLDLGCMYELADGRPGLVQALGNAWGDFDRPPYMRLAADDRTGRSAEGENLAINGDHFHDMKRALIFAFIYEGAPNWAATDGVATINMPDQAPIEVRLDQGGNQMMCAIAMIENRGGSMQVTKLAEYFSQIGRESGHELMDRRFGFGLRWTTGSKN
ncbi:tellurium resistance protein [Massilia violaceinigra]|uniref:Tellurium resistance protein n=1 Tax=Massilia violaceinigra TaxID=2045208 RepID=A0A2D2DUR6_9BURK|nr:TerD family protein [Massilia violaceinigra]ATQ78717.1 tellurium resistance protein [Massilia violaceinigra]